MNINNLLAATLLASIITNVFCAEGFQYYRYYNGEKLIFLKGRMGENSVLVQKCECKTLRERFSEYTITGYFEDDYGDTDEVIYTPFEYFKPKKASLCDALDQAIRKSVEQKLTQEELDRQAPAANDAINEVLQEYDAEIRMAEIKKYHGGKLPKQ